MGMGTPQSGRKWVIPIPIPHSCGPVGARQRGRSSPHGNFLQYQSSRGRSATAGARSPSLLGSSATRGGGRMACRTRATITTGRQVVALLCSRATGIGRVADSRSLACGGAGPHTAPSRVASVAAVARRHSVRQRRRVDTWWKWVVGSGAAIFFPPRAALREIFRLLIGRTLHSCGPDRGRDARTAGAAGGRTTIG